MLTSSNMVSVWTNGIQKSSEATPVIRTLEDINNQLILSYCFMKRKVSQVQFHPKTKVGKFFVSWGGYWFQICLFWFGQLKLDRKFWEYGVVGKGLWQGFEYATIMTRTRASEGPTTHHKAKPAPHQVFYDASKWSQKLESNCFFHLFSF